MRRNDPPFRPAAAGGMAVQYTHSRRIGGWLARDRGHPALLDSDYAACTSSDEGRITRPCACDVAFDSLRTGWDSNPRAACATDGLASRSLQPLGHPSNLEHSLHTVRERRRPRSRRAFNWSGGGIPQNARAPPKRGSH